MGGTIKAIFWRWTKSIRRSQHAKYAPTVAQVRQLVGEPPFSEQQWEAWGAQNGGYPLFSYSANLGNRKLLELSSGFTPHATTTSLRDLFHQELARLYDNDATAMYRHTPHRSATSLQASYQNRRKITRSTARCSSKPLPKRKQQSRRKLKRTKRRSTRSKLMHRKSCKGRKILVTSRVPFSLSALVRTFDRSRGPP